MNENHRLFEVQGEKLAENMNDGIQEKYSKSEQKRNITVQTSGIARPSGGDDDEIMSPELNVRKEQVKLENIKENRFDDSAKCSKKIDVVVMKLKSRFRDYVIQNPLEACIIKDLLTSDISPKINNFSLSLRKLINAAKILLSNPRILLMDDDSLSVPGHLT